MRAHLGWSHSGWRLPSVCLSSLLDFFLVVTERNQEGSVPITNPCLISWAGLHHGECVSRDFSGRLPLVGQPVPTTWGETLRFLAHTPWGQALRFLAQGVCLPTCCLISIVEIGARVWTYRTAATGFGVQNLCFLLRGVGS